MAATEEALTEIPDVGGITARCIADYFRGDQAKDLIRRLKETGVNMESTAQPTGDLLAGLTFVLTGELESASRKEAGGEAGGFGGQGVRVRVQKTGAVVAGEAAGSKLRKAQELGVPVLSEEQYRVLVDEVPRRQGGNPGPAGPGRGGKRSGINREAGAHAPALSAMCRRAAMRARRAYCQQGSSIWIMNFVTYSSGLEIANSFNPSS